MFHFFKKDGLTAFFQNGLLYKVEPEIGDLNDNREKFYNAKYIVVDGKKYNLENKRSIQSIATPKFDRFCGTDLGITGNLVYVLRMKASILKDEGKTDVALTLLKRATEMMPVSEVLWLKKDYMRFADWLFELGEEEEGRKALRCINELFEKAEFGNQHLMEQKTNRVCDDLRTDLVEASFFFGCCAECSKYRGRWYSRTGKDTRFPLKPSRIKCSCSGLSYYPVIYGISKPLVESFLSKPVDIIQFSNRPFIDERTEKERLIYDNDQKEKEIQAWFEPYRIRLLPYKRKAELEYKWICENLPEIAPKSLTGYKRMKNSYSKNFQKIADEAEKRGYCLRLSAQEEEELRFLNACKSKYNKVVGECTAFRKQFTWN